MVNRKCLPGTCQQFYAWTSIVIINALVMDIKPQPHKIFSYVYALLSCWTALMESIKKITENLLDNK